MVNDQVTMQYLLHTINVVSGDSEALFLSVLFFTLLMVYVAVLDSIRILFHCLLRAHH